MRQRPHGRVRVTTENASNWQGLGGHPGPQASPPHRYGSRETTTASKPPCQPQLVLLRRGGLEKAYRQTKDVMIANYGNHRFICPAPHPCPKPNALTLAISPNIMYQVVQCTAFLRQHLLDQSLCLTCDFTFVILESGIDRLRIFL